LFGLGVGLAVIFSSPEDASLVLPSAPISEIAASSRDSDGGVVVGIKVPHYLNIQKTEK
jgi:hypothetical protein